MVERGKQKTDGPTLSDVISEIRCLRSEARRLRIACSLGIGLTLVLVGVSSFIETELGIQVYSGLLIVLGIFVALFPYYHRRKKDSQGAVDFAAKKPEKLPGCIAYMMTEGRKEVGHRQN